MIKKLDLDFSFNYGKFKEAIEQHASSEHSVPTITDYINKAESFTDALHKLNIASFEGQKLSNLYLAYYAPKLNEIYYDAKSLVNEVEHLYNTSPECESIKTNAEKERRFNMWAFDIIQCFDSIKKLKVSLDFLGKYVDNLMFSLARLQTLVESLDKLQGKDMWLDNKSQSTALNVIKDKVTADDFKDDDIPF